MTDYLTQCNALAAEKKAWRWAKYVAPNGATIFLYREDDLSFVKSALAWPRTEYLGDVDGNPIHGAR